MENAVDIYNDSVSIVEETDERRDALGDITDPDSMTLEDFMGEWVFKNVGISSTPWFMKPDKQEKGYFQFGSKRFKGDYFETLLETQAASEERVISMLGKKFYEHALNLSKQLTGEREEVLWFVGEDGNQVMVREEVKTLVDILEVLRPSEMTLTDLLTKYGTDKAQASANECYAMFKSQKMAKEWPAIKLITTKAASYAKVDGDGKVSNEDVQNAIQEVTKYLKVERLSKTVYTFVVNLYWTTIKCRFSGAERAAMYKWLSAVSQEHDLVRTAEVYSLDNYYVNN